MFFPADTVDFAAAAALSTVSFSWSTLTASVPSTPAATFVILLPPLSKPLLVKDTFLPLEPAMLTPFPVTDVVLPAASLVVIPVAVTDVLFPLPSAVVRPLVSILVFPAVTLSTLISLFRFT